MLLSELMSLVLFMASIGIYAWKAGRNTWWFIATLVVLGIFIVLNIYALCLAITLPATVSTTPFSIP